MSPTSAWTFRAVAAESHGTRGDAGVLLLQAVIEQVCKYIDERQLLRPGDRLAVAVSGGADSVALLRALLELRDELGVVISVAHFHHGIRGPEADADQQFVVDLAKRFDLILHSGSGNVPVYAQERGLSLETAARELRHKWFGQLLADNKIDKIATAHTLDDQAETVLMRVLRGSGGSGLAGIAPCHREKKLVRPLMQTSRTQVEQYLRTIDQSWRDDSSNLNLAHTRNRIRHALLPRLEQDFNPAIRQNLADLAEIARAEAEYWEHELNTILPRVLRRGKPSRSGRSTSGDDAAILALDILAMKSLPLAAQRHVFRWLAGQLNVGLEFKHILELTNLIKEPKAAKRIALPGGVSVNRTFRELRFEPEQAQNDPFRGYSCRLPIPGEVPISSLGSTIRARIISPGEARIPGYNPASLLDRALIHSELIVRNWQAGDRFLPVHAQSPRKVKELLQPGRFGRHLTPSERQVWPVIESAGQIVWLRGFPVAAAFAYREGDAVLIDEIQNVSGT